MKCLSVRFPWWWFIFHLPPLQAKDVENRDWPLPRELVGKNVLIHGAKGCTKKEFEEACTFAAKAGACKFPSFDDKRRGGIVGILIFRGYVRASESPWFVGKFGWEICRPYPLPFRPYTGQLGFFEVT
jgi:hypothetical protein